MATDRKKSDRTFDEARTVDVAWSAPLEIREEIKDLFVRGGEPELAGEFDRRYRRVEDAGGGSVVGRDPLGKLVMHIGAFPRSFGEGGPTWRAAFLDDQMIEESYRDFWSPISFFRTAIEILDDRDQFDFLVTDPGEAAFALFRAAGFDLLDSLGKYIFPLVPGWFSYLHLRFPVSALEIERVSWEKGARLLEQHPGMDSGGAFRALRTPAFYESWVASNRAEESEWMVLRPPGESRDAQPVAQVLTTPLASRRTLGIMDLFWEEGRVNLESLLYAVAMEARGLGFRKLATRALSLSRLGDAIERCGFVARSGDHPILTRTLTDAALPGPERWLLTWMDGSG